MSNWKTDGRPAVSRLFDEYVRNELYSFKVSNNATVRSLANDFHALGYSVSVAEVGRWCQEAGPLIDIDAAVIIGQLMNRDLLYEFFCKKKRNSM